MTRTAPRRTRGASALARVRPNLWWLLPLIVAAAFYVWTATSGGNGAPLGGDKRDYYNLLADGFEHGHLYLPVQPAPELLALKDPYDPATNAPYRFHDASLYDGRYYLYFGPTPALVAFLPWSVLPLGGDLPGNLAAALFGALGLLFSLLLLRFTIRRWLPETPPWMAAFAAIAVALANSVPFILRRPSVYEQVLTAGYCFTAAAAWLLVTGLYGERRSLRRIGLGSLCAGLAVGCRPQLGLLAVPLALVLLALWRTGGSRVRLTAIVFGPFAACLVALAAYNVARFGALGEFGQSYQLAGVDVRTLHSSPGYLFPGLFFYLLAPARHDLVFPFFHISPSPHFPGTLPADYNTSEAVGGLFANFPITLLALAALALPWSHRLGVPKPLARLLALGVGAALVLMLFVAYRFNASTQRYEVDFAWLLVLAAVIVWIALTLHLRGRMRRLVQVAGVALIAWGAAYSVAISFTGYYDSLKSGDPETYRALADLGGPLQTAAAMAAGKPLMLEVNNATLETRGPGERYLSSVTLYKSVLLPGPAEVQVVSPSDRTVRVVGGLQQSKAGTRMRVGEGRGAPVVEVNRGSLDVPVRLRRGLNTLRFTPLSSDDGAPGDVRISDLRLR